jgi:hypothetical protein
MRPDLLRLLGEFAKPEKSQHRPEYPFRHLQSDGIERRHG